MFARWTRISICPLLLSHLSFFFFSLAFFHNAVALNKEYGNLEKAIGEAVKYCQRHDILNVFLEIHGSEVLNMILTEWNTEDAIAFAREEGREEGWEGGLEEGLEKGREDIAKNALAEGLSPEIIRTITGLDTETIMNLQSLVTRNAD